MLYRAQGLYFLKDTEGRKLWWRCLKDSSMTFWSDDLSYYSGHMR